MLRISKATISTTPAHRAIKAVLRQASFLGLAYLISDQALAPIAFSLRIASASDEFEWFECELGERGRGEGSMNRTFSRKPSAKCLHRLTIHEVEIDWGYTVAFGN